MAKHTHRLMLASKKTWRCTLEGCTYFVHVGLAYILPGKLQVCWECGEDFKLDETAMKDDMPKCSNCRSGVSKTDSNDVAAMIELQTTILPKRGKKLSELSENQIHMMINMGITTQRAVDMLREFESGSNEPATTPTIHEVIHVAVDDEHYSDCATSLGLPCDCK